MYNGSKLPPIVLVPLIPKPLHHLLVLEGCCMLDQDVPEVLVPVSLTLWECIHCTNVCFNLSDGMHCDTVHTWVLILLAYLLLSHLDHITNKATCCHVTTNLFHVCMSMILKPLVKASIHSIKVVSDDGVT